MDTALETQVQRRISQQLQRPMRMLLTLRLVVMIVIGIALVWILTASEAPTILVALALIGLGVVVFVASRPLAQLPTAVSLTRATFFSVIVMQTVAIAATGGLQSPLIVIYVPAMILGALMSGRMRTMGPALVMAFVAVVAFGLVLLLAPDALPALSPEWSRPLLGVVVLFACALGAGAGTVVRGAFESSVRAEAVARAGSIDMLRARNHELKELGSSLAHELKNPLAAIQGLTMQQLRNSEEGSRDAERLEVVVREVKRMSMVLEDFLSFARPFADVEMTAVDLAELSGGVLMLYRDHLDGLGITAEVTGTMPLVAPCDARQLDHVLVNLLLNAIEVSSPGSTIEFVLTNDEAHAIIEVCDRGPGLSSDAAARAFEAGFTTRDDGTGLGLAISRGIVNAHGGSLTLENRAGGGCVARIALPFEVHQ